MARSSAKPGARSPGRSPAHQHRAFIETACALGCNEDEAAFRDKMRVIARQKPKDSTAPPDKSKAKPKKAPR